MEEEMINKLDNLLEEYQGDNAKNIGMILTNVGIYLLENYEITKEELIKSFTNSIDAYIKYTNGGEEDE